MLADPRDTPEIETLEEITRKLRATETKLAQMMELDPRQLKVEVVRRLREGELDDYAYGGLVADWLYYRSAFTDWAAAGAATK